MNCKLQMGGSDQWGNITTGTELIRRKTGGEAFGLTVPLITKADGSKFGKSEQGNIWLDPQRTTSYSFYQFWLNTSDEDAEQYIKIFTALPKAEIDALITGHKKAPHERILQKKLAEKVTVLVHSQEDYEMAVEASQILFGKGTAAQLRKLDEKTFLSVFEGVPMFQIAKSELQSGIQIFDLLTGSTSIFPSRGELRRTIKGNGLSINQEKISDENLVVNTDFLIGGKYILIQKGKKNYSLIIAAD
jgi:tyrosyl-tRNA synthetase